MLHYLVIDDNSKVQWNTLSKQDAITIAQFLAEKAHAIVLVLECEGNKIENWYKFDLPVIYTALPKVK